MALFESFLIVRLLSTVFIFWDLIFSNTSCFPQSAVQRVGVGEGCPCWKIPPWVVCGGDSLGNLVILCSQATELILLTLLKEWEFLRLDAFLRFYCDISFSFSQTQTLDNSKKKFISVFTILWIQPSSCWNAEFKYCTLLWNYGYRIYSFSASVALSKMLNTDGPRCLDCSLSAT